MTQPGSMVMDDTYHFAAGAPSRLAISNPGAAPRQLAAERTARVWEEFALARPGLVLLARRRLIDATLSEDAVHDAVEGAIRFCVARGIDDRLAILSALRKAVGWRCGELNRTTTRARLRVVSEPGDATPAPLGDAGASAEAVELRAAIIDILSRLSSSDRSVLEARTLRSLTYAGVASEIGTTERQAERAVERALRRLRLLYAARAAGQLCEEASELLPLLAAGTLEGAMDVDHAGLVRQHAEGCLRCRMEQRFYGRSVAQAGFVASAATKAEATAAR